LEFVFFPAASESATNHTNQCGFWGGRKSEFLLFIKSYTMEHSNGDRSGAQTTHDPWAEHAKLILDNSTAFINLNETQKKWELSEISMVNDLKSRKLIRTADEKKFIRKKVKELKERINQYWEDLDGSYVPYVRCRAKIKVTVEIYEAYQQMSNE
jgi:hypothetical protein